MKKGFTLIELLIVVAIIAILAAIAVPNFLEAQTRAKVSRVLSDMRTINTGIETYKIDHNVYPINGIFVNGRKADGQINWPPSYNRHVLDPVLVTTPIAYIGSEAVTLDAFQAKLLKNVPKSNYDEWILGRMIYYSYDNYASEATKRSTSGGAQIFGPWRLTSAGPDQALYNGRIPPEGTIASRLIAPKYRVYDASNGTISVGDIWRVPNGEEVITRRFPQND